LAYTIRLLSLQGFSAKQMTGLRQELQKTYRARKMVIVQSDRSVDYLQKLSILVIIAMGGYQVKNGLAPGGVATPSPMHSIHAVFSRVVAKLTCKASNCDGVRGP
jgi:acetolactate synthase regulatory subunit